MHPLFESPKLDRELRNLIRENFREFVTPVANISQSMYPATYSIQAPIFKKEADQRMMQGGMYYYVIKLSNNIDTIII